MHKTFHYIFILSLLMAPVLSFAQNPLDHNPKEDNFVDATRAVDTSTARRGTISVKVEDGREVRYFLSGSDSYKITQCLESCQADLFKCTNGSECEIRAEFDKGNSIRVRELSEIRTTKTGATFTRVSTEELIKLGVTDVEACVGKDNEYGAWAEPDYKNSEGQLVKGKILCGAISQKTMCHPDAQSYCENKGMQTPNGYPENQNGKNGFPNEDSDFVRYRKHEGAQSVADFETPKGYAPKVLPNQTYIENGETRSRYFWSSSVRPNSSFAYGFGGRYGGVYVHTRTYSVHFAGVNSVRCVVARR